MTLVSCQKTFSKFDDKAKCMYSYKVVDVVVDGVVDLIVGSGCQAGYQYIMVGESAGLSTAQGSKNPSIGGCVLL